jgi:glucoamylase
MERFASVTGLLPEQVWDEPDQPEAHMRLGRPTGAVMPLMWAHAEYIKLLRSAQDGQVFDVVPQVADRYLGDRSQCRRIEVWKANRQVCSVRKEFILRVQAETPFRLHWSTDDWQRVEETPSTGTSLGFEFVDISVSASQQVPIRFTFFWTEREQWEGRDHEVAIA